MRNPLPGPHHILPLLALTLTVAGCDLVAGILEFGFWTGVIFLLLIIAVIWWVASKFTGGRRGGPPPPAA